MRPVAWAWIAVVMAVLAGCGPTPAEVTALATLRDPRTRMARFTEIAYEPLVFPSRTPFIIDGQSPMAEFPTWGRSYGRAP